MELIGFTIAVGTGIAIGMYITTQISESIDNNIRRKKFHKNMEDYDKRKSNESR